MPRRPETIRSNGRPARQFEGKRMSELCQRLDRANEGLQALISRISIRSTVVEDMIWFL
jgi:hypothetical protein